jgi:RecB family exonuclease
VTDPPVRDSSGPARVPVRAGASPRAVSLVRVPGLRAAHRAVAILACGGDPFAARERAVLVPTRGAAWQLRSTIERLVLVGDWRPSPAILEDLDADPVRQGGAVALPDLLTRADWYRSIAAQVPGRSPWLDDVEREVLLQAACDDAIARGIAPPFTVRPGLVAGMLAFYDALRRRRRTIEDFERLVAGKLEGLEEIDRGARRLLQQTRFLAAVLRGYEARLDSARAADEHRWRGDARAAAGRSPHRHVIVTLADQDAESSGLWAADFDLMTWLPGLERIDVVATERMLHTGLHERFHHWLPGIVERRVPGLEEPPPVLVVRPPTGNRLYAVARDREDEVGEAIDGLIARAAGACGTQAVCPIDECAVVFSRPLPYLYLARQWLDSREIPYEATDALPLAAEPYAAALDLVLELVASGCARPAAVALLSSPHVRIGGGPPVSAAAASALDAVMRERGVAGGRDRLEALASQLDTETAASPSAPAAARAARAVVGAADELAILFGHASASAHLAALIAFLDRHACAAPPDAPWAARERRAQAAVHRALADLRDAHARHADRLGPFADVAASIRRAIEAHTFAPRTGRGGLHLVDEPAARYGTFTAVHLAGLVEGEWPAPPARNVFYPASLLAELGWPREASRVAAARAAFVDLLHLARGTTSLSAFMLEDESLVRPSALLEDLDQAALAVDAVEPARVAITPDPQPGSVAASWVALRRSRLAAALPRFHGDAGPTSRSSHAVTSIETYLDCPFRYFAGRILRLEEERPADPGLDLRRYGAFVHDVFERFFADWERAGGGAITDATMAEARERFAAIAEAMLATRPRADRVVERLRLLGSVVASGLGERALRLEAEREAAVAERQLEVSLTGEYDVSGWDTTSESRDGGRRRLSLRGIADRIDFLADGTLRVVDYKSGAPPDPRRAIQLPVYGMCAEQRLDGHRGRRWRLGEATYVAFGDARPGVSVIDDPGQRDAVVAAASRRLLDAVAAIERGHFPPQPADLRLCATCAWAAVCRKDYVDAE